MVLLRASVAHREGPLVRRHRLSGLLNYYKRTAA
jgi:hypothetical protein